MAKSNLLNTETKNLLDLIGNGRVYRVPPYQRDYSWREDQWDDLWKDVRELRGDPEKRHYMGALVVEGKSDREFQIIDGQQRLATLSLFALAVIAELGALADAGHDPEDNRERARSLRAKFIGEKDPASLLESSKLFLNEVDNPFYQDYLVQLRTPLNPRKLPRSNRLLFECFRYFRERIAEEVSAGRDGVALTKLVSETLARQLLFILITVADDVSAYTVFETLNARGLELSATDLLKNYLFSRVSKVDLVSLQRRWHALITTVPPDRFPEFLRYHLLCEHPQVRSQRLFKLVRDDVENPDQVFRLMDALEGRAELFAALGDQTHGYWVERADCLPWIKELSLFGVRQMTPLLFAVWDKLPSHLASVLRLVSVISFRYTVISGLNTNQLEPAYHHAARAVLDGRSRTPAAVFSTLASIYVDDGKFKEDFARLQVDTSGQRKKLAKYILCRLEAEASGKPCDPDTDTATIEHVLPENPSDDWSDEFPQAQWDEAIYRLGNLTLLESGLNRQVGNGPYSSKAPAYSSSQYVLTQKLAESAPSIWSLELLNDRQRKLAERACHVWRLDMGR